MIVQPNRHGHVAIIVTAREYQALTAASALYDAEYGEQEDPPTREQKTNMRALDTLLSKCRDAGIRTGAPR